MEKQETKTIINIDWGLPLPPHIAPVIFSKLPISNLPSCRLVSKSWNHLVLDYASSSKFLPNAFLLSMYDYDPTCIPVRFWNPKIHCLDIDTLSSVASYEFYCDLNTISIVNSCNGLLFIVNSGHHSVYDGIFNPMTGELFRLPGPELEDDIYFYFYGFGFSLKTKQYKLFRVFSYGGATSCIMEIFTFGRNGSHHNQWRHVCLPFPITLYHHGAYLDGVVYWIGREKENEYVIYALDVETEQIKLIAVLEVGPYSRLANLQPFNGTIYAIIFMYAPCPNIQVWRMREKDSWIRDFVVCDIRENEVIHLLKAFEDGEILFLVKNDLFCLDKSGRKIKIKTFAQNGKLVLDVCHIESLHFGSLPNILAGDD